MLTGTPYCLNCKANLPHSVKDKESFTCLNCGSYEFDFGIKED